MASAVASTELFNSSSLDKESAFSLDSGFFGLRQGAAGAIFGRAKFNFNKIISFKEQSFLAENK